ncbi:MAG: DUF1759 domain-containing protein, partial [Gammaproteobacteria bacterium]|nr:DUF1759 domain-containing protein [Gammaproteobacteria bacterium]
MSGPIRQVLGPQMARIKTLIGKASATLPDSTGLLPEQKQQNINTVRIRLKHDIEKLERAIDFLLSKDKEWCTLIQMGPADQRAAEGKLYCEAVSSANGHIALINAGQDKVAELNSMVLELDYMFQSIQDSFQRSRFTELAAPQAAVASTSATDNAAPQRSLLKLPKLELPKFNGDPVAWKPFWDMFCSSVDAQPISGVQKFAYLSGSLVGPAAAAVRGL